MGEKIKSALELAMEKLGGKQGADLSGRLSPELKEKIAAVRSEYKAKIAEREIMYASKLKRLIHSIPPAELAVRRAAMEAEHRDEVKRLEAEMEEKIGKIREAANTPRSE